MGRCTVRTSLLGTAQHQLLKQLGIQESWIGLPGPNTIAGVSCIAGTGDLLPHLEAHLKVFGNLGQIVPELIGSRRSVEGRLVPYGPEKWFLVVLVLTVFAETLLSKLTLGILLLVDLAQPAFIGPGRGAEANERRCRHGSECTAIRQLPQWTRIVLFDRLP